EHLLRPGTLMAGFWRSRRRRLDCRRDLRTVGNDRIRLLRRRDRSGDVALIRRGADIAKQIAAIEDQPERLEDEQAGRRDEDERNEPEVSNDADHAASAPTRARVGALAA